MSRITVKVRPAGQKQTQIARDPRVFLHESGVVIRMKRFDRVQASRRQRWNPRGETPLSGMSDRRQAARLVNDVDDGFRRRTFTRHEARPPGYQPAIERLVRVGDISRLDHRARDVRTPDGSTGLAVNLLQQRLDVDRNAMGGQPRTNRFDAGDALCALPRQQLRQRLVPYVEHVAKHVQIPACLDGGNLDAGHGVDAPPMRFGLHFIDRCCRIVIGDGHHRDARLRGPLHELTWRAAAIGRSGVKVKVDAAPNGPREGQAHRAARAAADPCRTVRRVRPCRFRSARYSRTSRSR